MTGEAGENYEGGITQMSRIPEGVRGGEGARPLVGRSALVAELRKLSARDRQTLGLPEGLLVLGDLFVSVCAVMIDDSDPRPMAERLSAEPGLAAADWAAVEADIEALPSSVDQLPPSVRRLKAATAARFLQRLLGAATYHRLEEALKKDMSVLFVALRRGLRFVIPHAAAMDNCVRALSPEQRSEIPGLTGADGPSYLEILVEFDRVMHRALDLDLPINQVSIRPPELESLTNDVEEFARAVGADVSQRSMQIIQELSGRLLLKVRGARDALEYSSDPISQAANSLVEFIDRLLRSAFSDDEVVAWVERNYPERLSVLTFRSSGSRLRPTKRGQALCFAHAGESVGEDVLFEELAALAIVAVRNQLEELKHADDASEADQARLLDDLAAVEGFLVVVCRVSWMSADEDVLERLRERIETKAA